MKVKAAGHDWEGKRRWGWVDELALALRVGLLRARSAIVFGEKKLGTDLGGNDLIALGNELHVEFLSVGVAWPSL